jgi:hypothetical protein
LFEPWDSFATDTDRGFKSRDQGDVERVQTLKILGGKIESLGGEKAGAIEALAEANKRSLSIEDGSRLVDAVAGVARWASGTRKSNPHEATTS